MKIVYHTGFSGSVGYFATNIAMEITPWSYDEEYIKLFLIAQNCLDNESSLVLYGECVDFLNKKYPQWIKNALTLCDGADSKIDNCYFLMDCELIDIDNIGNYFVHRINQNDYICRLQKTQLSNFFKKYIR